MNPADIPVPDEKRLDANQPSGTTDF